MSTSALILMILVQGFVTIITIYFLVKVLRMPPKADTEGDEPESDS